jgi:hypothetical protein
VLVAGQALARADKPAKPRAVNGTVAVTKEKVKDEKGTETEVIKSITISATGRTPVVYSVVLDDSGKKVAEFDGKKVKATGTIEEKDGNKWLTVQSCELLVKTPKKEKETK